MRKPESCKPEMKGQTAVRRSPTDAASLQPWWRSSSRWEQHKLGSSLPLSRGELSRVYGPQHQPAPLWCTCQKEEKEETIMRRSRGAEEKRAAKWVNQRLGAAMRGESSQHPSRPIRLDQRHVVELERLSSGPFLRLRESATVS